jgi:DNA polymerase-3 subunit epsilon
MHPGQRNSLDALCKRYEIDNSSRELHGALLDAEILSDVYLAMTGGQTKLNLSLGGDHDDVGSASSTVDCALMLNVIAASAQELEAHQARLNIVKEAGGSCLWLPNT